MFINKITIHNLRCFKGTNHISFKSKMIDEEKNTTVIIAENGVGKTTLMQAFLFCLYGIENMNLSTQEKINLLNSEIAQCIPVNGQQELYVELNFNHEGYEYIARRTLCYKKHSDHRGLRLEGGETVSLNYFDKDGTLHSKRNAELFIKTIIPHNLSHLYFIDGERDLTDQTNKESIGESVTNILGLINYKNAMKHIGTGTDRHNSAWKKIANSMKSNTAEEQQMERLKLSIERDQASIARNEESIKIREGNYKNAEKVYNELHIQLQSVQHIHEKQHQRRLLRSNINNLSRTKEEYEKQFFSFFSKNAQNFFVSPICKSVEAVVNNTDLRELNIRGIEGRAINDILARGYCICGNCIQQDSKEYQKLLELQQDLPPQSLSLLVTSTKDFILEQNDNKNKFFETMVELYKKVQTVEHELRESRGELEEIEKLITNELDIEELNKKYKKAEYEMRDHLSNIDRMKRENVQYREKIEDFNKSLRKLQIKCNDNKILLFKQKVLEELYLMFNQRYKEYEKEAREALQENVSMIYNDFIHDNYQIKFAPDYSFSIFDRLNHNITARLSEGQKNVTSFAFVCGLIRTAKQLSNDLKTFEDYPLVMDAPFATLDNVHRENISSKLPEYIDQLILFSADSQWEGCVERNISPHVAHIYEMIKTNDVTAVFESEKGE